MTGQGYEIPLTKKRKSYNRVKIYDLLEKSALKFPTIHLPSQCRFCTSGRGPGRAGEAFWPHLHTETATEALEGHFHRAGELQEVREGVARTRVMTGMTCGWTASILAICVICYANNLLSAAESVLCRNVNPSLLAVWRRFALCANK